MPDPLFETMPRNLKSLLEDCGKGEIQLPDFQRGWVWDEERIIKLIGSVANSHPVGALMALKTGGELNLGSKCIEGTEEGYQDTTPHTLILDGQQRLTSLYQATLRNEVVKTISSNRKEIKRWFYIDIEMAIESQDITDAVFSIPENKITKRQKADSIVRLDLSTAESEYKNLMFPVTQVFSWYDWQEEFRDFNEEIDVRDRRSIFKQFKEKVLDNFSDYLIPVITLKDSIPKVAVCNVFEKVNTAGKALDAFELLTAIYAADEYNLRDDWFGTKQGSSGRKQRLIEAPFGKVLENVSGIDFLQAISLFHTREKQNEAKTDESKSEREIPAVSCNRQAVLDLPLEAYKKYAELLESGFIRAAKFLFQENIFFTRDLPYQSQIVPLAALLADLREDWENVEKREKISKWYWNGVFGELYGSSVDTRNAKDFVEIPIWLNGSDEPATVKEARFSENRLDTLRSRTSAAYKGIHALLMKVGAKDFRSGQEYIHTVLFDEPIDIHHIFPKKWCTKNNIEKKRYNSIINKTPLSSGTNNTIGGDAPSDYLEKLENKRIGESSLDEILESHLIDRKFLNNNDFNEFIDDRRAKLCKIIESAMGKSVHYENGKQQETEDGEYLNEDDEFPEFELQYEKTD